MSEHDFKPGDKVRFRADAAESERSFFSIDGSVQIIPAGEAIDVLEKSDWNLPQSPPPDSIVVAWGWFRVAVRGACLEPCEDRPKCTCDIGTLIAAGCKCGGA